MARTSSFDLQGLLACARGELFGEGNARLPLPPLLMFDRITRISEHGGSQDKGEIEAELEVRPDLWFFKYHFQSDPVMPGCLGPSLSDDERRLTPKGKKRMQQIARSLRRLDLKLDRIVTSPLPRARATAEIVADELDADDRLETADILRAGSDPPASDPQESASRP